MASEVSLGCSKRKHIQIFVTGEFKNCLFFRYHDKVGVAPANLLIAAQSKCTSSEDKLVSGLMRAFH